MAGEMTLPSLGRRLWEGWKRTAHRIGNVQAKVILGLLYFLVVGPVALVRRLVADPLGRRWTPGSTYWHPRPPGADTLDAARRQ